MSLIFIQLIRLGDVTAPRINSCSGDLSTFRSFNELIENHFLEHWPLHEYAQRPYDRDVLVRLIVKKTPMQLYYQSVRNSQTDIPVLTCAAARMETGDYRIVIGARPLRAVRFELPAEPALAAEQLAAQFAESIKAQIVTGSNMRGSAEYRRHLAGVLTKRAVLELEQRKMQEEK